MRVEMQHKMVERIPASRGARKNIVEKAIWIGGEGSLTRFAKRLTLYAGFQVSRQAVNNWRSRGAFSRNVVAAVHALTNLPMTDLIDAPWLHGKVKRPK